jgi:nitrate reductase gamma subunit
MRIEAASTQFLLASGACVVMAIYSLVALLTRRRAGRRSRRARCSGSTRWR